MDQTAKGQKRFPNKQTSPKPSPKVRESAHIIKHQSNKKHTNHQACKDHSCHSSRHSKEWRFPNHPSHWTMTLHRLNHGDLGIPHIYIPSIDGLSSVSHEITMS